MAGCEARTHISVIWAVMYSLISHDNEKIGRFRMISDIIKSILQKKARIALKLKFDEVMAIPLLSWLVVKVEP